MDERGKRFALIAKSGRVRNLDLRGVGLAGADLSGVCADELDLRAADLCLAKVRESRFGNSRFERAKVEKADWSGTTLRMCVFDGARCIGCRFDGARIEDSSAKGADLTAASLRGTKLTETCFERAVLRGAVLDDAEGEGVEFRGADLVGASMIGARLDEADFRGANLQGANLSRGRFRGADFRGAILEDTRFDGADCTGALFDGSAGPRSGAASNAGAKASNSFDEFANTALRQGLATLPGLFAARDGTTAEFLDGLQRAVDALAATDNTPEDWKPWLEALAERYDKGERPADVKAVLAALGEGPPALQNLLAAGGVPATEFLTRLQHLVRTLDANPDHPSEEWKASLEPLMNMIKGGQPLDLKVALDVFSSLSRGQPSTTAQTSARPTEDPGSARNT
jgi:uncharacterized protein YjbI with pentapeptide repeats